MTDEKVLKTDKKEYSESFRVLNKADQFIEGRSFCNTKNGFEVSFRSSIKRDLKIMHEFRPSEHPKSMKLYVCSSKDRIK